MASTDQNHIAQDIVEIRPRRGAFDLELSAIWRYRELLYHLVWRELKVRYKQAALGAAWAILQPLVAVAIFTLIFGRFARFPSDGAPYAVFVFAAILPWTYFAEAMRRSSVGLVTEADLVRKIYFPRLIIPLAGVIAPMVDFLIGLAVLLAMLAWYDIWPTWNIVLLPVALLGTMLLALSVGLWLGPINVRFRDVMHTLPFVIQIWMYASPIVYPLSLIPEEWRAVYSLNPMVGVIESFRWALLGKAEPDFTALGVSFALVLCMLVGGLVFFRRAEGSFADVI